MGALWESEIYLSSCSYLQIVQEKLLISRRKSSHVVIPQARSFPWVCVTGRLLLRTGYCYVCLFQAPIRNRGNSKIKETKIGLTPRQKNAKKMVDQNPWLWPPLFLNVFNVFYVFLFPCFSIFLCSSYCFPIIMTYYSLFFPNFLDAFATWNHKCSSIFYRNCCPGSICFHLFSDMFSYFFGHVKNSKKNREI